MDTDTTLTASPGEKPPSTPSPGVRRFPLWRDWLEVNEDSLAYGQVFRTSDLERDLGMDADSVEFAFAIMEIRRALRRRGMVFTSRGQNGEQYVIEPPETNQTEMQRMQRRAIVAMREGVILGTNTPLEHLNAADRRRHEAVLERMATRLALISRKDLPSPAPDPAS